MSTRILSASEILDIYKNEIVAKGGKLVDFEAGSVNDIRGGAMSTAINEAMELVVAEFRKTFFGTAEEQDLENLAIDHFGESFSRPDATNSTATYTFSRATTGAGNATIPKDTVVKTGKDANGREIRYITDFEVIMSGLSVNVPITSVETGPETRADADAINVIESALTDPSIVGTNINPTAGGTASQEDPDYRETISGLIDALAGATEAAIRGAVEAVPEIEYVSLVTIIKTVIEWDSIGSAPIGGAFKIPYSVIYVADANGAFSSSLIEKAEDAILDVRACGVKITVVGANSTIVNWTAEMVLNPAGPNYAELSLDTQPIKDSMSNYINSVLGVDAGFNKTQATNYILSIWGPGGTDDLASFATLIPTASIIGVTGTKLVSGDIETV